MFRKSKAGADPDWLLRARRHIELGEYESALSLLLPECLTGDLRALTLGAHAFSLFGDSTGVDHLVLLAVDQDGRAVWVQQMREGDPDAIRLIMRLDALTEPELHPLEASAILQDAWLNYTDAHSMYRAVVAMRSSLEAPWNLGDTADHLANLAAVTAFTSGLSGQQRAEFDEFVTTSVGVAYSFKERAALAEALRQAQAEQ